MSENQFHMPIIRTQFFGSEMQDAINDFLNCDPVIEGFRILAVETEFHVAEQDRELIAACNTLQLIGEKNGQLWHCNPREITDAITLIYYSKMALQWTMEADVLEVIPFNIFPPRPARGLTDPAAGKMFHHLQTRDFGLFGSEYLATAATELGEKILGPAADLKWRSYYENLILPPAQTAHEKIEQVAKQNEVQSLVTRLYDKQLEWEPDTPSLAPLDYTNIIERS